MRLALPLTPTDEFSPHYGAAAKFAVFEVGPAPGAAVRRLVVTPQDSEPCEWPRLLRVAGVGLVLAGGMGRRAQEHMAGHGIDVVTGVRADLPERLVESWLAGVLHRGPNQCEEEDARAPSDPASPRTDGHCSCHH